MWAKSHDDRSTAEAFVVVLLRLMACWMCIVGMYARVIGEITSRVGHNIWGQFVILGLAATNGGVTLKLLPVCAVSFLQQAGQHVVQLSAKVQIVVPSIDEVVDFRLIGTGLRVNYRMSQNCGEVNESW